jgi:hypothetical protein
MIGDVAIFGTGFVMGAFTAGVVFGSAYAGYALRRARWGQ